MSLTPQQVITAVSIGEYGGLLPVLDHGAFITGGFNLVNVQFSVTGYVAGSIPLAPGEIHNFYKPVEHQPGWWIRRDDLDPFAKPKRLVHVVIKLGEQEFDKHLLMSDKSMRATISVANFINTTNKRITASVSNFTRVTTTATVQVRNFVKKWWS